MRRSIFSLLLLLPLCGVGTRRPRRRLSLPLHPPAPAIAPATIAFSPAGRTEELPQLAGDTLPAVRTHRIKRLPLDRRRHACRDGWRRMIPTHVKVQYAGGMGFLSFGAGWDYGRKCQWETDLYLGFLPRSKADKFYVTTTAKQSYIPWSIACGNRFAVEPFYCGMYVNTIIGEKFWVKEPDRYPRKYYTFSTKIHTFLFIGQRLTLYTNRCTRSLLKGVTAYYELSTCDLYLISAVTNKKPRRLGHRRAVVRSEIVTVLTGGGTVAPHVRRRNGGTTDPAAKETLIRRISDFRGSVRLFADAGTDASPGERKAALSRPPRNRTKAAIQKSGLPSRETGFRIRRARLTRPEALRSHRICLRASCRTKPFRRPVRKACGPCRYPRFHRVVHRTPLANDDVAGLSELTTESFTPSRLLSDSRPFFELPTPFCVPCFSNFKVMRQFLQPEPGSDTDGDRSASDNPFCASS